MSDTKKHIGYKIAAFALMACLVLPIAVKFAHLLEDHEHEVCLVENQSHFHEIDMDCEFYKFKINHNSIVKFFNLEFYELKEANKIKSSYYSYLRSHKQLTTSLRGPPSLT